MRVELTEEELAQVSGGGTLVPHVIDFTPAADANFSCPDGNSGQCFVQDGRNSKIIEFASIDT